MDKPDRSDYFASGGGLQIIKKNGTTVTVPMPERTVPKRPAVIRIAFDASAITARFAKARGALSDLTPVHQDIGVVRYPAVFAVHRGRRTLALKTFYAGPG